MPEAALLPRMSANESLIGVVRLTGIAGSFSSLRIMALPALAPHAVFAAQGCTHWNVAGMSIILAIPLRIHSRP